MATDKPTLEIVIQRLDQLTKLQESLLSSNNSARNLETTFNGMRALIGQLAGETAAFNKALAGSGTTANNLLKNLGAGGVENLLSLTANKGKIAKLKGEYGRMGADLVTAIYAGMRAQSKALDLLPKIKLKDAIQDIASRSKSVLTDQIVAQRARVFAATAEADAKLAQGKAAGLNQLQKEQAALKNLEKGLLAVNRAEEARILLLKRRGEAAAIAARQETVPINGGKTFAQLALPGRGTTPAQGIANRLGDPNYLPQLFKIQAGLTANYLIMSQIFSLFSFGSRFVIEFDKALQDLAAVADITDTEMVDLKDTIVDVASTTKFTAVDVSKAALVLGQAGLGAQQIAKAIGPITLFATAVGTDLITAAESATSVLNIFNLSVDDTAHVANVLVGAINKTKLSTEKLVTGLQYAGNAAAQSGATLEETVAVLGALANAGIKSGSTLGTGLRNVIIELQNPNKKLIEQLEMVGLTARDVDIQSQGLIGALQNLTKAGFGTENAFKAFEVRGAAAFLAISNNIGLASQLQKEILLTNAAAEANAKQMRSLSNVFAQFSGQLGVAIEQGFEPVKNALIVITKLSGGFIDTLRSMKVIFPAFGTLLTGFGVAFAGKKIFDIAGAIGLRTLITDIPLMIAGLTGLVRGLRGVEVASLGVSVATAGLPAVFATAARRSISSLSLWTIGITAVVLGIQALTALFPSLNQQLDQVNAALNTQQSTVDGITSTINSYEEEIKRLTDRYGILSSDNAAFEAELLRLQLKFPALGRAIIEGAVNPVQTLIDKMRELKEEMNTEKFNELIRLLNLSSQKEQLSLKATSEILGKAGPKPTVGFRGMFLDGMAEHRPYFSEQQEMAKETADIVSKLSTYVPSAMSVTQREISQDFISDYRKKTESRIEDVDKKISSIYRAMNATPLNKQENLAVSRNLAAALEHKSKLESVRTALISDQANMLHTDNIFIEALKQEAHELGKSLGPYQEIAADTATYNEKLSNLRDAQSSALKKGDIAGQGKAAREIEETRALLQETLNMLTDTTSESFKDFRENLLERFKGSLYGTIAERREKDKIALDDAERENAAIEEEVLSVANKQVGFAMENLAQDIRVTLASNAEQTAETVRRTGESAAGFFETVQETFTRLDLVLQESLLPLDRKEAELNSLMKENEDVNSPMFGRFSDATISEFSRQLKDVSTQRLWADIQILKTELDVVRNNLYNDKNGQDTLRKYLVDQGATGPGASTSDREQYAAVLAHVNELKKKELDLNKDLIISTEEYNAAIGVSAQNNLDLETAIQAAIQASDEQMRKNFDLGLNIKKNIGGALEDARAGLSTFLQDWARGTATMGDAARALGITIVESLIKKVADAAAASIIGGSSGFLGGLFGGFLGGDSLFKEGGLIRAASGKHISTRDSVPILAQPGEYVLRQSAVQMIGKDNLDMINASGNRKMSQSRPQAYHKPVDPVFLNVYVVPPNERPSMSKHDVVAAITDDMLRGGATKKLVKSIAVGSL